MKKGFNRLDTFVNWPVPYLAPRVMAAASSFYSGTEDTVECNFCHIQLDRWRRDDILLERHRKSSPHCSFVIRELLRSVSSTESGMTCPVTDDDEIKGEDVCGRYFVARNSQTVLVSSAPKEPSMAMYKSRLATFN